MIRETQWQKMTDAREHLQSGLDLLDEARAPGHIGAYVDLALHELEKAISESLEAPPFVQP